MTMMIIYWSSSGRLGAGYFHGDTIPVSRALDIARLSTSRVNDGDSARTDWHDLMNEVFLGAHAVFEISFPVFLLLRR